MSAAPEAIVVRVLASMTALVMCMSPSIEIYRIHQQKAVGCMPALPLVAQWLYNHAWMLYGFAVREYFPLIATYAAGSMLSVLFLSIFYLHAHGQRPYMLKLVVAALLLNIAATGYLVVGTSIHSRSALAQYIGALAILYGVLMYASPLATVVDVVRTKNAASVPLAMVAVGATSNAVWIVYGYLLDDPLITIPSMVNAGFCALQLSLCAVYHPKRKSLKVRRSRFQCRSACIEQRVTPPHSQSVPNTEHELSCVHLETPKYDELRSPRDPALCA